MYTVQVFYLYFHLATLTYSPKCYGLLITFSLIMLGSPRLLLLLSTWYFFCWIGRGDHPETYLLTKGTFLSEHSFMVKSCGVGGWWWWVVALGIILSTTGTGSTLFPIPIFPSQSPSPSPVPNASPQSQAQAQSQPGQDWFLWITNKSREDGQVSYWPIGLSSSLIIFEARVSYPCLTYCSQ